jgi:hypothetical protein
MNKKILLITGISGGLAGLAASNIDGWFNSIIIALLIGLTVGYIGSKFFSDESN